MRHQKARTVDIKDEREADKIRLPFPYCKVSE